MRQVLVLTLVPPPQVTEQSEKFDQFDQVPGISSQEVFILDLISIDEILEARSVKSHRQTFKLKASLRNLPSLITGDTFEVRFTFGRTSHLILKSPTTYYEDMIIPRNLTQKLL